jgi:nucleotide-binding universal stress UspA family protein
MKQIFAGYERILAATDFSPSGDAALWQAHWAAKQNHCPLVVAHVESDLRHAISRTSYRLPHEFLEEHEQHFLREQRRRSDAKLEAAILSLPRADNNITYETLLGEPYLELTRAVQKEHYDLLVCGARSDRDLGHKILGSTVRRLIQICPSSLWVVKRPHTVVPRNILVAVDLSEVSRRALNEAMVLARRAEAVLHVLYVVEATEIPTQLLELKAEEGSGQSLRDLIEVKGQRRLDDFLADTGDCGSIERHLLWGRAWEQIVDFARELKAGLVAVGTVGRMGEEESLLGNTAENVLRYGDCDILAVKPAGFVSPVHPTALPLPPVVEMADNSGIISRCHV